MANLPMYNAAGQQVGEVEVQAALLEVEANQRVVHQAVVGHLAGQRAGTASTKGRSDVSGGGRKPWKQKGSGRARQGSRRSPLWRHGGVAMGPHPHDFHQRTPRKVRRQAFAALLSERARTGDVVVVDLLQPGSVSTREFAQTLANLQVDATAGRVLIIDAQPSKELELSARNLPGVTVLTADELNVYDVAVCRRLVVTQAALARLQETRI